MDEERYRIKKILGRYTCELDGSKGLYFLNIIRWKLSTLHLLFEKREKFKLPVVSKKANLQEKGDFFCLLGHATVLIQLNGVRILTDPVFGDIPFYKRYTPFPYDIVDLMPIDIVLISHSHYDHLDLPSLKKLKDVRKVIVPLNTTKYIKKIFQRDKIIELNWFDSFKFEGVEVIFLPSKHWCKRKTLDTNTSLWGSFLIRNKKKTLYFAGDSAYSYHFKDIGEMFKIDYAFLPIGAYKPDYIMKYNHMSVEEAYKSFEDLNARYFVPIHFGVFKLSDEPVSEPLEKIMQIISEEKTNITLNVQIGRVMKI